MNKDGFKLSNYQVRHPVYEKRCECIVDGDEESEDDDDYTDDEDEEVMKGEVIGGGPNGRIAPGISVFLQPQSVPQAYDLRRNAKLMLGVALMTSKTPKTTKKG